MGYTHYWTQNKRLTAGDMGAIAQAIQSIVGLADVPIAGWNGKGEPEYSFDRVSLNGVGDDRHETFQVNPGPSSFEFCKTASKPYDVVVTAALTYLAAEHGFEVRSDGNPEDWEAGGKLATLALGKAFPNPLVKEEAS